MIKIFESAKCAETDCLSLGGVKGKTIYKQEDHQLVELGKTLRRSEVFDNVISGDDVETCNPNGLQKRKLSCCITISKINSEPL